MVMKKQRSLLSRLQTNGICYLIGALILLLGVPLYQQLVLVPLGYSGALASSTSADFVPYLLWIRSYSFQFVLYRALLAIAFLLLLTLPFTLFRIIVAQEILAQQEQLLEEEQAGDREAEEAGPVEPFASEQAEVESMPAYAWRGKGFVVVAAWSGLFGLLAYILGTLASTLYFVVVSSGLTERTGVSSTIATPISVFSLITNTAGIGLLALATLFFGAVIARNGRKLWPDIWVAFGYLALAVGALLSGSAVAVASTPTQGQAALTSPAILLFALWVLWLGIMLVRLKPEA
jgi:hypothetical protein